MPAHTLWLQGKAVPAIQSLLAQLNIVPEPRPRALGLQAGYYMAMSNRWRDAATLLAGFASTHPADFELQLNLGVCLKRSGDNPAAAAVFETLVSQGHTQSAVLWDGLADIYGRLGRLTEAKQAGEKALALKDLATGKPLMLPASTPQQYLLRRQGLRNMISFSLWGSNPRYLRGALRNALLCPDFYPGWQCRFYLDHSVPAEFITLLQTLGCETVIETDPVHLTNKERLTRRFHIASDTGVGYFLVRDCDSVFNPREVAAVAAWLVSGQWFHIMRDGWTHTDPILAGMWGGIGGVLSAMSERINAYRPAHLETSHIDQWFLRDEIWPQIRNQALIHDHCFDSYNAQPFPVPLTPHAPRVGDNEHASRADWQITMLQPWIEKYSCLQALRIA